MILYVYCDEDDHPIAESETKKGLALKLGLSPKCVYEGFKKGYKPYVIINTDEDEEDE